MKNKTCSDCYWAEQKKEKTDKWYLCFRYPPTVIESSNSVGAQSPDVHRDRRACGEFRDKDMVNLRM